MKKTNKINVDFAINFKVLTSNSKSCFLLGINENIKWNIKKNLDNIVIIFWILQKRSLYGIGRKVSKFYFVIVDK